jgi:molecular chaperone GrpE
MLPVVDNFERAMKAAENDSATNTPFKEGMELVYRQLKDALKNLGVEEIKSVGEAFDPQLHNAVMHIEDDSYGDNTVIDEFQKGYALKDKVIRHSMVKVAN